MAFELYKTPMQLAHLIVFVIITPCAIAVTVLRFVATHRSARKPGLEDWLAVGALLFLLMMHIFSGLAVGYLNGRSNIDQSMNYPEAYSIQRKFGLVAILSYFTQATFFKLSILALYHRIFSVRSAYKISIYVLAGLQLVLQVVFCVMVGFTCSPMERYWDRRVPGTCKSDGLSILAGETPNSLVDFFMVGLAIAMIRSLKLSKSVRTKLSVLFGFGVVVGILGFIKVAVTYSGDEYYAFSLVAILSSFQMFLGLLCCCLPVFHPLLPEVSNWGRLGSRMLSYATFGLSTRRSRDRSTQRSTHNTGKHSQSDSTGDHPGGAAKGWGPLPDESSTRDLTFNGAAPGQTNPATTSYAMSEYPPSGEQPSPGAGITVQHRVDVV